MEAFLRDVRQALRGLRSERGFTAVAVLTLALGVGANTAIFSVVNGVLLQPLDFPEPHELLAVGTSFTDGRQTSGNLSINKLMAVREMSSVQSAGGTFPWDVTLMDAEERPVNAALFLATSGFFEAFGFPMAAGRPFVEEHYVNGGAIILGYALWQSFYGGDPGIIGNTVTTSNGPVTVVGVAPAGFDHPGGAEGWIAFNPGPTGAAHFLESVVRLRDGVSLEQARAEFPVTQQRLFEQFPQSNESRAFTVDPLMDFYVGEVRSSLLILMGAAVTLLIIACANVMSLLLSRGTVMGREVAVRIALGASRGQILRQLLTSSAVLAAAGAVLGLGLGLGLLNLVLGLAPADLPRMDAVGLDSAVVGYTVGLIFFSAVLFGTLPAMRLLGTDVRSVMGEQARGSSAGPGRGRAFRGLIATQVALAVVLVIGAGLLTRSFQALNSVDPGFEAQDRSIFTLRWDVQNYPWFRDLTRLDRELREALLEVPGVTTVASTSDIPLDALLSGIYGHRAEGGLLTDDDNAHQARLRVISPGYFETLGIPLAAGRPFNELDEFDNPQVVVLNQTAARQIFGDTDPVGQVLTRGTLDQTGDSLHPLLFMPPLRAEVVGVAEDVRYRGLGIEDDATVYHPLAQLPYRTLYYVVESRGVAQEALSAALRQAAWTIDSRLPVEVVPMLDVVDGSMVRQRFSMTLILLFGASALLLAAVGIYGVIAYSVSQRTTEVAIRSALGAAPSDVLKMILTYGGSVAGAGLVAGAIAAILLRNVVASQLYGISALDPVVLAGVPILLGVIALVATYLPARRVLKIDLADTLRRG